MKISHIVFILLLIGFWSSCSENVDSADTVTIEENPAEIGFDLKHSDEKAIELADKVMKAMGGRKNWDNTKILKWNFFGKRTHYWNKETGDIRIEIASEDAVILMNINSMKGKAKIGEFEPTENDSLSMFMNLGKEMWINDSYWLVMPFKLKDSGVTLKYLQKKPLANNEYVHALELTFKNVGITPHNKYIVYVDPYDYLVVRWDFYTDKAMEEPVFNTTWENYQTYGNIKLSSARNTDTLTGIEVFESLPDSYFTSFDIE